MRLNSQILKAINLSVANNTGVYLECFKDFTIKCIMNILVELNYFIYRNIKDKKLIIDFNKNKSDPSAISEKISFFKNFYEYSTKKENYSLCKEELYSAIRDKKMEFIKIIRQKRDLRNSSEENVIEFMTFDERNQYKKIPQYIEGKLMFS